MRQLGAFQDQFEVLRDEGIRVVAASTDSLENATSTVHTLELKFPIGYGVPRQQTQARLGGYSDEKRNILHASGFLLRPEGTIGVAVYSSGAIGRLTPDEVLRSVRFWKSREQPEQKIRRE